MKTKIKTIGYSISSAALLAPALVAAQFDPTVGGSTNLPSNSIQNIIGNLMNWLLIAIGIVGVIGFAIAGILYLTSAGDETRIQTAKRAMLYSIVGIIVALAGLVAIKAAYNMLGARSNF